MGGCWPLLEACLESPSRPRVGNSQLQAINLYSREGLIRYILCCCQDRTTRGGLRDKPSQCVQLLLFGPKTNREPAHLTLTIHAMFSPDSAQRSTNGTSTPLQQGSGQVVILLLPPINGLASRLLGMGRYTTRQTE